ncbi:unnamed protein product, partial [Prunus brigantina]
MSWDPRPPGEDDPVYSIGLYVSKVGQWSYCNPCGCLAFGLESDFTVLNNSNPGDDDCLFSIRMHHGGRLIHEYYLDGTVTYFDYVDKDKMSLTEIDCMVVYLGNIGRIDYWYRVEDEGDLKRVEFDSEVIEMCENVHEVRMINMYMDHRDNLDNGLNSHTDSNYDKAIVLHDELDEAISNEVHRTRKLTPSMNSATAKGKETVVDKGCVQHEPNKSNSKGKENVAEVDEGYVQHETNKATSKGKE